MNSSEEEEIPFVCSGKWNGSYMLQELGQDVTLWCCPGNTDYAVEVVHLSRRFEVCFSKT